MYRRNVRIILHNSVNYTTGWPLSKKVRHLFIDLKKVFASVRRLIAFGILLKLVRLIKMCLDKTYSRVRVCKHLSDMFAIKNGLKQGDALSPVLFNSA